MKKVNTERKNIMRKDHIMIMIKDIKVPKAIIIITKTTTNIVKRVATQRVIRRDLRKSTTKAMIMTETTVNHKNRRWKPLRRWMLLLPKITIPKHPIKSKKKLRHPTFNIPYTYTIPRRKPREQCRWMVLKSEGWTEDVIAAMKKVFQMCDVDVYLSLLLFLFTTYSRLIYL